MTGANLIAVVLVPGLMVASVASAAEAYAPERNPFVRPQLNTPSSAAPMAIPQGRWLPELRTILLAGDMSMVNVGGKILRLGDDLDGYRLVKIKEGEAIFTKDGKYFRLLLTPDLEDENE